ncbi:MAG TPA: imidazole glycerol phosphate synthase subunit HisH [Gemmatales bacterium]|nr:imidazole glycerol phosphate synthase subunit HisH [Gemmatales bacterium]
MSIVIMNYGIGNLRSVQKTFEKIGVSAQISADPEIIRQADRLVLPGVGAFADCMQKFDSAGLREPLVEHLHREKPLLGICVGMQMLFTTGTENGIHPGLNILAGTVERFPQQPGFKIPPMGWNQVQVRSSHPPWEGLPAPAWFYFVHSYHCIPEDTACIALETEYVIPFCPAVQKNRLLATQFHPEKSQAIGQWLLRRFLSL